MRFVELPIYVGGCEVRKDIKLSLVLDLLRHAFFTKGYFGNVWFFGWVFAGKILSFLKLDWKAPNGFCSA
jgi:hypothetical protein